MQKVHKSIYNSSLTQVASVVSHKSTLRTQAMCLLAKTYGTPFATKLCHHTGAYKLIDFNIIINFKFDYIINSLIDWILLSIITPYKSAHKFDSLIDSNYYRFSKYNSVIDHNTDYLYYRIS